MRTVDSKKKEWGVTREVVSNESCEMFHATTVAGGYSSAHLHEFKYNLFYVMSGEVHVTCPRETRVIKPGEKIVMPPGVMHAFFTPVASDMIELYWSPHVHGGDIIRQDTGGVLKDVSDPERLYRRVGRQRTFGGEEEGCSPD